MILKFISNNINTIIIVSGVAVGAAMVYNFIKLLDKKNRIEEKLFRKDNRYFKDAITREISEQQDDNSSVTPDKIRGLEADFNSVCTTHGVLVQLIPIFPLLGILGTVAGLMLEVQAKDTAAMLSSLDTALTSTFLGLIFAIGLKFLEAVLPSKIISEVEVMLDDFDKKMSLAEMFRDYSAEK